MDVCGCFEMPRGRSQWMFVVALRCQEDEVNGCLWLLSDAKRTKLMDVCGCFQMPRG